MQLQFKMNTFESWVKIPAEDSLKYFYLPFPENQSWHCIWVVSLGDILQEISSPIFYQKWEKIISLSLSAEFCLECTLWANSGDNIFFSENRIWHLCKLSPMETVCRNCQNQFSGKNKKNISIYRLLKILPRVLSINGNKRFNLKIHW